MAVQSTVGEDFANELRRSQASVIGCRREATLLSTVCSANGRNERLQCIGGAIHALRRDTYFDGSK